MVVAVSGGPDSVALLHALAALGNAKTGSLTMAHLNHQLRGAESDADEAFVRELHRTLHAENKTSVTLCCERADVASMARAERANLEATARRIRYAWLAHVTQKAGASCVATGHTADDQAETVLHRLIRGTGLRGLRGIAPRRKLALGIEVVRPLLGLARAEVLAYLGELGQAYRTDSSNMDLGYTRNRIRAELLPLLARRYNPAITSILCRLAEQADELHSLQQKEAQALLAAAERPRAGSLFVLDRERLASAPRHLVREVFRLLWEREGWPQSRMGFHSWDRLAAVARGEAGGVDLPGGLRVLGRERVVQVRPSV
jgi:tRNA(Ile)-lysidine synthase